MACQKKISAQLSHNLKTSGKYNPTYRQQTNQFCKYLSERGMGKITQDRAVREIQPYLDYLAGRVAPDSVHTAAAALAAATRTKMSDYTYGSRTSIPTRGRAGHNRLNEINEREVEFAKVVGIREKEYAHLRGDDLIERSGRLYVIVEHGKGGKYQEQLIRERDEAFVRAYFSGRHEDRVFTREEVSACHNANLHAYRREHAREMYDIYAKLQGEEREQLKQLVREQFMRAHERNKETDRSGRDRYDLDKKIKTLEEKYDKPYYPRGDIRQTMKDKGQEPAYDRLALVAVSCLHLSHWRCDVAVKNYLV